MELPIILIEYPIIRYQFTSHRIHQLEIFNDPIVTPSQEQSHKTVSNFIN